MLEAYRKHLAQRESESLPPLPLEAGQVAELIELIKQPPQGEAEFLLSLLIHRVPPGVDQAAYVKAAFLADIAKANIQCELIDRVRATELLGTMLGGYNIDPLIELLDDAVTADAAATALSHTLLRLRLECCAPGPMRNGSPPSQHWPKKSPSRYTKYLVKPTQTTCHLPPKPGAVRIFRCTLNPCWYQKCPRRLRQ